MRDEREALESPTSQGEDEKIPWSFDFSTQPGSPTSVTSPAVVVYDVTDSTAWEDVTITVLPSGSASVAGAVVTTPLLQALTRGRVYRIECKANGPGGAEYELFCIVMGTR